VGGRVVGRNGLEQTAMSSWQDEGNFNFAVRVMHSRRVSSSSV
jgi:hypothetical protein